MDIQINNKNGKTLKTKDTYVTEDINVIPVLEDVEATSNNADGITPSDGYSGIGRVIVNVPIPESEEKTVDLNMTSGNQVITPSTNKVMSKVTVNKPATLLSQNIKKDVAIGGIVGTLEPKKEEQEKTVSITNNGTSTVQPDSGKVLSKVNITTNVQPDLEEKTVNITENGTQEITPTSGKDGISKVNLNVNVPSSSGGADLNIYYGDTAPEDTSKLWIKSSEPTNITFTADPEQSVPNVSSSLDGPDISREQIAAIGEDIWIFGQSCNYGGTYTSVNVNKYNTKTKALTDLGFSIDSQFGAAVAIPSQKKIYYIRGSSLRVLDVETNERGYLTTNSSYFSNNKAGVAIGNTIYFIGDNYAVIYNTLNNTYTTKSLGFSCTKPGLAVVGKYIYIFCNRNGSSAFPNIYKYDTETNDKTLLSVQMPTTSTNNGWCTTLVVGSSIYYFLPNKKNIYKFDTVTETIITLEQQLPSIAGQPNAIVGNKAYFIGSPLYDGSNSSLIMTFAPTFSLPQNDILIQEGYLKNTFDLVKAPTKVEMSAQNAYKGNASGEAEFVDAYVFDKSYWKNINTEEKLPIYALSAPTNLSLNVSTLSWTAVENAKTYEIFSDGTSLGTATTNTIDLSTLSSWSTITVGTHSLTVKAKSDEYLDSPASSAVMLTMYSIDTSGLQGVTVATSDPTTIVSGGTATLNLTATQYSLPIDYQQNNVVVNGATYAYSLADNLLTATLKLTEPTSNVTVAIDTSVQTAVIELVLDNNITQVAVKGDLDSSSTTLPQDTSYAAYVTVSGGTATITATCTFAQGYELDTATPVAYKTTSGTTNYTVKSIVDNVITLENTSGSGLYNVTLNLTSKTSLSQLSAPANVTVDGTTASWDEVENATNYELFVDGVSIGESTGEVVTTHTIVVDYT